MTDVIDSTAVVVYDSQRALAESLANPEKLDLIQSTIMPPGSTRDEFDLFIETCRMTGLNPIVKQIYPMKSGGKNPKLSIVVGIDGYRLIAQRTGEYDGQDGPFWCGEDGIWRDVWVSKAPPLAAKVVVYRSGVNRGFTGIANYDAYVQTSKNWDTNQVGPNPMWTKMPANQLAKCAESLALRKAFPAQMSGIYTEEEMGQSQNGEQVAVADTRPRKAAPAAIAAPANAVAPHETHEDWKERVGGPDPKTEAAPPKRGPMTLEEVKLKMPEFAHPALDILYKEGKTVSALKEVLGTPDVRVSALRAWEAAVAARDSELDPALELIRQGHEKGIFNKLDLDKATYEALPDPSEAPTMPLPMDDDRPLSDIAYERKKREEAAAGPSVEVVNRDTGEVTLIPVGQPAPEGFEFVNIDDAPFE